MVCVTIERMKYAAFAQNQKVPCYDERGMPKQLVALAIYLEDHETPQVVTKDHRTCVSACGALNLHLLFRVPTAVQ